MTQTAEQALADVRAQLADANLSTAARIQADAVLAAADAYDAGVQRLDADLAAVDADPALSTYRHRHRDLVFEGWAFRTDEMFPPLERRVAEMAEHAPRQTDLPVLEQAARVPVLLAALYAAEKVRRGVPRNPPRNPVDVTV